MRIAKSRLWAFMLFIDLEQEVLPAGVFQNSTFYVNSSHDLMALNKVMTTKFKFRRHFRLIMSQTKVLISISTNFLYPQFSHLNKWPLRRKEFQFAGVSNLGVILDTSVFHTPQPPNILPNTFRNLTLSYDMTSTVVQAASLSFYFNVISST